MDSLGASLRVAWFRSSFLRRDSHSTPAFPDARPLDRSDDDPL